MSKRQLEGGSPSRAKWNKSRVKDLIEEITLEHLEKVNSFTCIYVTTWASAKSEIVKVQEVGLVEFRKLDWCTINVVAMKKIICAFKLSIENNTQEKSIVSFDYKAICKIFKLQMKGTNVLTREPCNQKLGRLFEGNKEDHYVKDVKDM